MLTLKAAQFDWSKEERLMTGEMSELCLDYWPDMILIESERTNSKILFEIDHTQYDRDDDIQYVKYRPIQTQSAIADIRMMIFND
jgi:hypothetical protein